MTGAGADTNRLVDLVERSAPTLVVLEARIADAAGGASPVTERAVVAEGSTAVGRRELREFQVAADLVGEAWAGA